MSPRDLLGSSDCGTGAQICCSVWLEGETPAGWTVPERYGSSRGRSAHTRRDGRPARKGRRADCKGSAARRRSLVQLPVEKFSPAARVQRTWAGVLGPAPPIPARSPERLHAIRVIERETGRRPGIRQGRKRGPVACSDVATVGLVRGGHGIRMLVRFDPRVVRWLPAALVALAAGSGPTGG